MNDRLRMRFAKEGRAVYISHLDLMHTFQRAFSRAGYDLKYSEGFNPHPLISIAMPLSVGVSSSCEIMDFRLADAVGILSEMPERLTDALPEGIRVLEVYEQETKACDIKWLEASGTFIYDDCAPLKELESFFSQPEIVILKKTKRGTAETDIMPTVRSLKVIPGSAVRDAAFQRENASAGAATECEKTVTVHCIVSANEPVLNPELLVEALRQKAPDLVPDYHEFRRIEIYKDDMKRFR